MRKLMLFPLLAIVLGWTIWLRPAVLAGPAGYVVVSGRSMEPTLYTGDLVITQRQLNYEAGDIIAYRVSQQLVIHRIIGGSGIDGFETQGDNKSAPDPWHPTVDKVLGKLWVHLPGAGTTVFRIRQPIVLAALATGTAAVAFPPKKRKRRRAQIGSFFLRALEPLGESSVLLTVLFLAALLSLLMGAMAVYSFSNPQQVIETIEHPLLTHGSAFSYVVHMEPSTLDPDGALGPVNPAPDEDTVEQTPVSVFTKLATNLELTFNYNLDVPAGSSVNGEFTPQVRIDADDAWSKTFALESQSQFTGSSVSRVVRLDFAEVESLIGTIESETGFDAGSYNVAVIPQVRVHAQVGEQTYSDTYAPEFTMQFDRARILLESDLARSETRTMSEQVTRDNTIPVFGQMVSVRLARWVSLPMLIVGVVTTALVLMVGFLGFGQAEALQIEARYGSMILSVKRADLPQEGHTIDVASFKDLARLAQQNGRNILHMRLGKAAHLYFVQDGELTYKYMISGPQLEH